MTEETTRTLMERYPITFSHLQYSTFECRDGWFNLIDRLGKLCEPHKVQVECVKEKFGIMRIYTRVKSRLADQTPVEVYKEIEELERISGEVCEGCGDKGTLRGATSERGWWIMVHCDACEEKHLAARKMRFNHE